jgi:hypothetical protein
VSETPARPPSFFARIPTIGDAGPGFFFWLNLAYLLFLLLAAWAYTQDFLDMRSGIFKDPVGGLIPIGVPLAGALGGILISLYGVFVHNARWKKEFNYWHAARPFMGAILGSVGFLMFLVMMNATGVNPPLSTGGDSGDDLTVTAEADAPGTPATTVPTVAQATDEPEKGRSQDLVLYYVLAFVIGYREETFRELIKRVLDIIFRPGGGVASRAVLTANPRAGPPPLRVLFDATASTAVASWTLDFGDGAKETGTGVPGSFSHEYEAPGTYLASLVVTGEGGGKSVTTVEITVGAADGEEAVEVRDTDHGDEPIPDEEALTDDRLPPASGRVGPE